MKIVSQQFSSSQCVLRTQCQIVALTSDPAMKPIEARMPMTEATRLREPMIRVPVFREAHAQQFGSFGRATIFVNKYWEL